MLPANAPLCHILTLLLGSSNVLLPNRTVIINCSRVWVQIDVEPLVVSENGIFNDSTAIKPMLLHDKTIANGSFQIDHEI